MAQKFLSIKNFEKYQHFKKAMPPWIKLYRSLFGDRDFMLLSISSRYLYIGLIILASEGCNRIANDPSWIAQRLSISPSDIDLKPLYKSGLLIASESSVRRYTEETETETETEKSRGEGASAPSPTTQPDVVTTKKKRAPGIPTTFPDSFAFSREMKDWALEEGCQEPYAEFEHFRDKAKAEGKMYIDWAAAFRTWIHNHVKWKREKVNAKVLQNVR